MAQKQGNPNLAHDSIPQPESHPKLSLATRGVHADDEIHTYTDVAPALHVSTNFRYPRDPDKLRPVTHDDAHQWSPGDPIPGDRHVYSRETTPNHSRLEVLLSSAVGAPCLAYSSGLAAFFALITHLHPKVVAIGAGYHGSHGVLATYRKLTGCRIVDLFDEQSWAAGPDGPALAAGDVVHLETPVNPTGKAFDIQRLAHAAHARGALLTVDSTFAPPPLQDPFAHGADFVWHSGTKYFGGHSDMLCGVIAVGRRRPGWERDYWGMFAERTHLGSVMGSLEGWLGVRSMRTLELRVVRQSESAGRIVRFLHECLTGGEGDDDGAKAVRATVAGIEHASLQERDMPWLRKQMPAGFGPVFAMSARSAELARRLPSKLDLFHHATSLGGVESLVEWRRMSDPTVDETLVRISVGVEAWEDLRDDIVRGCRALVDESR